MTNAAEGFYSGRSTARARLVEALRAVPLKECLLDPGIPHDCIGGEPDYEAMADAVLRILEE